MSKGGLDSLALAVPAKVCKDEPGEEEDEEEVEPEVPVEVLVEVPVEVPEVPVEVGPDPLPLKPEEAGYHWVLQQMPEWKRFNAISLILLILKSISVAVIIDKEVQHDVPVLLALSHVPE